MEKELDLSIIKATQLSLGKYVKRPPLSEKLLKKPPFRFLHDIVTSVLKSTGFFEGLFEDQELISDNVKDRDAKITFLNKVLYVITKTVGKELSAKPSKIVAGQEPEKTNELLQCLAEALDKKITSKDAVRSFRESTNDKKNVSKEKKKLSTSKSNIKNDKNHSMSNKRIKSKENIKHKLDSSKNISQEMKIDIKDVNEKKHKILHNDTKKNSNEIVIDNMPGNDNDDNINSHYHNLAVAKALQNENKADIIGDNKSHNNVEENANSDDIEFQESDRIPNTNEEIQLGTNINDSVSPEKNEVDQISDNKLNENSETAIYSETMDQTREPEKYKNKETPYSNANIEKSISSIPSSVRPSSSRPGAPRVRDKQDYRNLPEAENIAIGKVNIISENVLLEEDEESTVVIENYTDDIILHHTHDYNVSDQHGHLVQQILNSQKEFTQVNKTEIDWTSGSQKIRDDFSKEIELLRFNVQALSRVANPLGKILDHIQEDVEVMRQELSQWLQIYNETTKKLLKEKALNDDIIAPLRIKTSQLDMDISERYKKIDNLKIIVYKNNAKIDKLLAIEHVK